MMSTTHTLPRAIIMISANLKSSDSREIFGNVFVGFEAAHLATDKRADFRYSDFSTKLSLS